MRNKPLDQPHVADSLLTQIGLAGVLFICAAVTLVTYCVHLA